MTKKVEKGSDRRLVSPIVGFTDQGHVGVSRANKTGETYFGETGPDRLLDWVSAIFGCDI